MYVVQSTAFPIFKIPKLLEGRNIRIFSLTQLFPFFIAWHFSPFPTLLLTFFLFFPHPSLLFYPLILWVLSSFTCLLPLLFPSVISSFLPPTPQYLEDFSIICSTYFILFFPSQHLGSSAREEKVDKLIFFRCSKVHHYTM